MRIPIRVVRLVLVACLALDAAVITAHVVWGVGSTATAVSTAAALLSAGVLAARVGWRR